MMELVTGIINKLLSFLKDLIMLVLDQLPDSPFLSITQDNTLIQVFKYANYFLPIREILTFLPVWLSAILAWYGLRWLLRIAKYID